jgi:membrane protease YdiL (CAAX protease family)
MLDYKKRLAIIGLFISLIGYYLIAVLLYSIIRPPQDNAWASLIYTLSQIIGFLSLIYIAKKEDGGFFSIYFGRLGLKEISLVVTFWLVAFILWLPINFITTQLGFPIRRWGYSLIGLNFIPVTIWAIGAAFFEEAFFRGYALTRLPKILNNIPLSIMISVIAFAMIHLRFGLGLFIYMLAWATIISYLFIITKSTWSCFLYHFINNIVVDFLIYSQH